MRPSLNEGPKGDTMLHIPKIAVCIIALLPTLACQQKPEGQANTARDTSLVVSLVSDTPDASKLGVFAGTEAGVKELVIYGEQTGRTEYRLPDLSVAPTVGTVKAFFLNMPDTKVMNSKIFWIAAPQPSFDEDATPTLPVQVESVKGNMYKLLSPELSSKRGGVLLFKVGMPLGTADRMYAIKLQ